MGLADDAIVVRSMWWVYILRCADSSLYIGETGDLDLRRIKHNDGTAWLLLAPDGRSYWCISETHLTHQAALKRERQLKCWTRAKKEALVAGDAALLKRLLASTRLRRETFTRAAEPL